MNVTELARKLKVAPQELRDLLPEFGFHIGQKAIKIDNRTAMRIIKEWPRLMKAHKFKMKVAEEEEKNKKQVEGEEVPKKIVKIPGHIVIKEFANISQVPVSKILGELMKNGIFASMNEKIDFDTAAVIGSDLDLDVQQKNEEGTESGNEKNKLSDILGKQKQEDMGVRPPVIVVMGHVDHGKTKLLDTIRTTNIVDGEAGGITQHIGAYQVTRKNKLITFIDTPGHEAFTAMRSRGAKIADVAILVVAADDGVKPQTIEAYRIIESAKIPFIVAINKIDKAGADINKTKQELSTKLNITPEDWGGKTVCVPVSALKGDGVDDILDMILLTADMAEGSTKANPKAMAVGTVIESHVDKGAGPKATILIQNGTLKIGDMLTFEGKQYGKVKALKNYLGENISEALPSVPAEILGLKIVPEVGDILEVGQGEKIKTKNIKSSTSKNRSQQNENQDMNEKQKKLNLIIKSDVLGSAEAIEESLEKISTEDVRVKIIHKGLGYITEGDISKAESSDAQIVGFHIKPNPQVEELIRDKEIKVSIFQIIYDLIEYVRKEMEELIEPEIVRVDLGNLKVLAKFRSEPGKEIIGGKVLDGKLELNAKAEIWRDKEFIGDCGITKLQSGKQNVNEIEKDQECGLQCEGNVIIEEGDIIKAYKEEKTIKRL